MKGTFQFLGTGSSGGIPTIGCKCAVCTSDSPYNQRMRPAGFLQMNGYNFLIDCGPDIRMQALRFGIDYLDGMFVTHTHYDHIGGLDDLRIYNFKKKSSLPVLCSEVSYYELLSRHSYMFREKPVDASYTARFMFQLLERERGMTDFHDVPVQYVTYHQGPMPVNGYRFGNFAYISDIKKFPETIYDDLKGVKFLVVSALRESGSYIHFSTQDVVDFAHRVGAEQTYLTHICHDMDHQEVNDRLPEEVQLGYDGLELEFEI